MSVHRAARCCRCGLSNDEYQSAVIDSRSRHWCYVCAKDELTTVPERRPIGAFDDGWDEQEEKT